MFFIKTREKSTIRWNLVCDKLYTMYRISIANENIVVINLYLKQEKTRRLIRANSHRTY